MKTDEQLVAEAVCVAQKERADAWPRVDPRDVSDHAADVYARLVAERTAATLAALPPRVAEAAREIGESISALSSALEAAAEFGTSDTGPDSPAVRILEASKAVEVDAMHLGIMFGRRGRP